VSAFRLLLVSPGWLSRRLLTLHLRLSSSRVTVRTPVDHGEGIDGRGVGRLSSARELCSSRG
jgi:hypothetical protein